MAPVLGYWKIRGLAEPIRFLLHHAGVPFEDKRYNFGANPMASSEWLDVKYTLGLDFPNLPYYIDEDHKITQSFTIIRYLAKKHGLYPTSEADVLTAETLEQLSRDIVMSLVMASLCNAELLEIVKHRGEEFITQIVNFLGDREWLVSGKVTYADFLIYESIVHVSYRYTDTFTKHPKLLAFVKRIEALPNIQKYMKGEEFQEWPLYSPYVSWGGSGEAPKREGY